MKVESKAEKNPCVIAVSVKADAEEIKAAYQKVVNEFVREGQLPGFRKGKAPVAVVKQKFADGIKQEAERMCFQELYPKALEEAKIVAIDLAGVRDVIFDPAVGFSFTAVVEVKPDFKLPKYEKLTIKGTDVEVKDADVESRLAAYRAAFAKFDDAKEGAVIGDGDFVMYDFKGMIGDKSIAEVVPEAKAVSEGTGSWTQIEEGRFVPEVLEAMKGMKAGETKTGIKVTFPKDGGPEGIRGKQAVYEVTIKSIRSRTLPTDEEFIASAKAESLDALRADIRKHMEEEAKNRDLEARRSSAIEQLLKKADFEVPPSLMSRQAETYLTNISEMAQRQGVSADTIEKDRETILKNAEEYGTRQVRLSYILLGIADKEEIKVSDEDVTAGIERVAAQQYVEASELRAQLEKSGRIPLFKEQLRAEKALDLVLAKAK